MLGCHGVVHGNGGCLNHAHLVGGDKRLNWVEPLLVRTVPVMYDWNKNCRYVTIAMDTGGGLMMMTGRTNPHGL